MNTSQKKANLLLHFAVFLFGMTAIFGALIDLSAIIMVWWRVLITSISLILLPIVYKDLKTIPKKTLIRFLSIGVLVAFHWITFYGAIKLSNASVALVCFALVPLFTSILEPIILNQEIEKRDVIISLFLIPGMILIVQNIQEAYYWGILVGLVSSLLVSLFTIYTKKYIEDSNPITISFLEIFGALLTITFILPFVFYFYPDLKYIPNPKDWKYLLLLSILCTSVAYVISTEALKYISAFNSNLIVNLEPIYGIVMASIFLNENKHLDINFYIGTLLLFTIALGYPILKSKVFSSKKMTDDG